MRELTRYLCLFFVCLAAVAQSDRDFSGRWYYNPSQSELEALPEPPDPILKIDQQGATIRLFRAGDGDRKPEEIRTYNTDGRETRRTEGEVIINSATKWEGSALMIDVIVSAPHDNYNIAERWKLSKDRSRLTISRHILRASGEADSTLIYEREAAPKPPVLITHNEAPAAVGPLPAPAESQEPAPALTAPPPAPVQADFVVAQGTKLPLRLLNSVSTKHSAVGDKVYLETIYPILSHGKVIIPPGSYVMGSLSEVKQAGRVKGKSEMYLRFDTLTLPNGTTRDFRSRMSSMDSDTGGTLDRKEGSVKGDGGKAKDAATMGTAAGAGAGIGALATHSIMGAGIGAGIGAAAGLIGVLATRGPDAVLQKGSTVEMVLDRDLTFTRAELRMH